MPWHIAATEPGAEFVALGKLTERGIEAFLPLCRYVTTPADWIRPWKASDMRRLRPLFGRYVFVKLESERQQPTVRATQGVRDLLCQVGGGVAVVPDPVIDDIRERIEDGGGAVLIDERPHRRLRKGDRIVVGDGPMTSYSGLYQRHEKDRIWVLIDNVFGRKISVSVRADLIRVGR